MYNGDPQTVSAKSLRCKILFAGKRIVITTNILHLVHYLMNIQSFKILEDNYLERPKSAIFSTGSLSVLDSRMF